MLVVVQLLHLFFAAVGVWQELDARMHQLLPPTPCCGCLQQQHAQHVPAALAHHRRVRQQMVDSRQRRPQMLHMLGRSRSLLLHGNRHGTLSFGHSAEALAVAAEHPINPYQVRLLGKQPQDQM